MNTWEVKDSTGNTIMDSAIKDDALRFIRFTLFDATMVFEDDAVFNVESVETVSLHYNGDLRETYTLQLKKETTQ